MPSASTPPPGSQPGNRKCYPPAPGGEAGFLEFAMLAGMRKWLLGMRKWQKSFSHRPRGAPGSQWENDKSHFQKSFSRRRLVIFFLSLAGFHGGKTAASCSKMSWKKPSLVDDPVHCSNVDDSVLAWKRPRLSLEPPTVRTGRQSWQKPSASTVQVSSDGNGAGGNHLVWHSISIDEPTLALLSNEELEMTDYERNALDPNRIAKLSAQSCGCRGSCFTLFQPRQILGVCRLWHGLSDDSQHHFLNAQWEGSWDCGGDEEADAAHRTTWFFAGQRVCLSGLCGLLGTGKRSMLKKVEGVVDTRRKLNNSSTMPREPLQANLVDMFFLELLQKICLKPSRPKMSMPRFQWSKVSRLARTWRCTQSKLRRWMRFLLGPQKQP